MISSIVYNIKKFLFFYESLLIRFIVSFGAIISLILVLFSITSNPLSDYHHDEEIDDICIEARIENIVLNKDRVYNDDGKIEYIYQSEKIYYHNENEYWIIDTTDYHSSNTVKIRDVEKRSWPKHVLIDALSVCDQYVHPLPFFYSNDNGMLLMGSSKSGNDLFSKILFCLAVTMKLSLWALLSFLIFGISMGIFLGYYRNRYPKIYSIVNYIQKIIESIPVILWMIITINLINVALDNFIDWQWQINFFMFGIYSSTALSKLLVDKFENFKSEDFIVALKLLGISDFRIIFIHIIRYQCLPIIVLQITYIIAQCIYLDMTLSVIEFSLGETIGSIFADIFNNRVLWGNSQIISISLIIYSLLTTLFYTSNYWKEKIR